LADKEGCAHKNCFLCCVKSLPHVGKSSDSQLVAKAKLYLAELDKRAVAQTLASSDF